MRFRREKGTRRWLIKMIIIIIYCWNDKHTQKYHYHRAFIIDYNGFFLFFNCTKPRLNCNATRPIRLHNIILFYRVLYQPFWIVKRALIKNRPKNRCKTASNNRHNDYYNSTIIYNNIPVWLLYVSFKTVVLSGRRCIYTGMSIDK